MCTAITFNADCFYFGRNLDLSYHYNETVTVSPRKFPFRFRNGEKSDNHFAIIGVATVADGYPLYYDAANEMGLCMAGLNFPDNAVYRPKSDSKINLAPFELIPYILSKCATADEAYNELEKINVWNVPFSESFPLSPLHWIVTDENRCFTVEPMSDGVRLYENPVGVLTNNPPFNYHMYNLSNYMMLSPDEPQGKLRDYGIRPYSLGMGAIGLPGDLSSASRFVRAVFAKTFALKAETEYETVNQFFGILGFTEQIKGLTRLPDGKCHYTVYSSCCNANKGLYYYTTYEQRQIVCVDMHKEELNEEKTVSHPMIKNKNFFHQN